MANYILKNIPDDLWKKFKLKCVKREVSMKDRLIELIKKDVGNEKSL